MTELSYALDTLYFLFAAAFVMWMAAGFTMLEAGLVRPKNTVEILTKNVALYAIACIMYLFCGYQIMYGGSDSLLIPGLAFGLGEENAVDALKESIGVEDAPYYSARADFFFQVVFVATAMSIVSGAVAERMKLWAFLAFAVVLTSVIYPVSGYWTWGGGVLSEAGYVDFAGSGIVHMAGAAAALAGVLLLGPRKGKYGSNGEIHAIPGGNLPLATLGMFILWMGWFGFNGGSQLKMSTFEDANAVAQIFVNTNAAAAAGVVVALIMTKLMFNRADLTMAINGALGGLVAITADPLSPSAGFATAIGAVGAIVVVLSVMLLEKAKIDDPVGAISVHGSAGIFGLLVVPLSNPEATFMAQVVGIASIFAWVFVASAITWYVIKLAYGLRVSEEDEVEGVDTSECGMKAYAGLELETQ